MEQPNPPAIKGSWLVAEIDGEPTMESAQPSVNFSEDGRVSGSGTVNRIAGSFVVEGDTLTLSPLACTMMAGPPDQMQQENRFLAAMSGTLRIIRDGDAMALESSSHRLGLVATAGETDAGGGQ